MTARALDAFGTVIFRGLAVLRLLVIAFTVAYVAIWWHDWYGGRPGRLLGPALTTAWAVGYVAVASRRALRPACVVADVGAGVAIALTAPWTMPQASLGDPSSWVFLYLVLAGMSAVCALRTRWSLMALVILAAAQIGSAYDHRPPILTSTGLLLFICVATRQAIVRLLRVAGEADAWLDAVEARSRAEAVAAARARGDREHERFLHDTVLNTLAGIDLGGAGRPAGAVGAAPVSGGAASAATTAPLELVRRRCRRVVDQVEQLLAGTGDVSACPPQDPDANLDGLVRGVLAEARDDGLDVAYRFVRVLRPRWRRPARGGARAHPEPPTEERLPLDVVSALAAALREALTNVRRHSGVWAARVTVVRWLDGVRVRVDDAGVGFDAGPFDVETDGPSPEEPPEGPRARLGLRGSVHGRMVDVGGWASIASRRGAGTRVELHWQAPPPEADRPDGAKLSRDYEQAIRRGVGAAVLAGVVVLAVPAFGYRHHAQPSLASLRPVAPVASVLLWAVFAVGAARIVAVIRRRPLDGPETLGTLVFTAAVVLGGAAITSGDQVIRIYDWAGTVAPAVLLLPITVSRPMRQWMLAVAVVIGVELAVGLPRIAARPLDNGRLLGAVFGLATVQLLVTIAGPLLRATADATMSAAAQDARLGAAQDSAAAVRRDRARRLARLNRDVLPLLRAVADGVLDPRDDTVRRQCGSRARALRRMLTGGAAGPLPQLETAIDAAEARGALVVLQVAGDLWAVARDVREELVDLLSELLRMVPPGRVTVTLLCDGGSGFVSYPVAASQRAAPGEDALPAQTRHLVAHTEYDDDNAVVELRWPVPTAAA